MDFQLTDEQRLMQESVRELMLEQVAPRAAEIDEKAEFPWDVFNLFAKNDILALVVPEEYGGIGADLLTHCLVIEEIARVCASSSMILGNQSLGSSPIILFGTEEQKRQYGPGLASGKHIPSFGLSEPEAGSDVSNIATRAVADGDDFIINGRKVWITEASIATVFTVFAKTALPNGKDGLTGFIVERETPGVIPGRVEHKMGLRGSPTCELILENVRVPRENVLRGVGEGYHVALGNLDKGRISVAAQAVGIAQGAVDYAVEYAKNRVTFGQPIAKHQMIQALLAEMETEVQAARALYYRAAWKFEHKQTESDFSKFSAMAKFYATEMVRRVTQNCVQILGGYGFTKDYPAERMMRDSTVFAIFEGTNQIQRIVIARALTGRL